jgi:putative membrane protein insertion efficiency factor
VNWAQHILIFGVRAHQRVLTPVLVAVLGPASQCRFEPSCSRYAAEAVQTHGAVKGSALAAWRICRCQPWGKCGHDPVPPVKIISNFNISGERS